MSALITVNDVNDFYNSGKSDNVVQSVINAIDAADACLAGSGATEDQQKLVKIYACCHQLTLMNGGELTSETSMTGSSVSFAAPAASKGLDSTRWGMMLKSMPGAACIEAIFNVSDIQVFSVGRRCQ